ncbi:glycosyltransferase family A protein [Spongiactinospora sp. TRM90649]|uniref:glycosyltransferase family A protein n=1 Tax=Spongiactinospora sp. TRM90649 TaxID=3031114 RepID=UPI0023F95A11|nr:glycosyltransferase family A protein [Spongiactinospora sp. TRM90649]MDF5754808.1 glycosyltransferase family A protein [Spongiactinospora sp. TRM90649]
MTAHPSVGVVIATRGARPGPLCDAVLAALRQDYPGHVEVIVVADGGAEMVAQVKAQLAHVLSETRAKVRVTSNQLTNGLPGTRNTGVVTLDTDIVAFCDDDDVWMPGKLSAQISALSAHPTAEFASCGIEIEYGTCRTARLAGTDTITHAHLTRSRMVMVHSSTFLFWRHASFRVDESAPGGQNEDWDLALRAAKRHPIVHVDLPLVRVRWGASDYLARWADRIAGLHWMLTRHTELAVDSRGAARIYGQLAFAHAALGHRREACRWALRASAARPAEPRAALALVVAAGLVSAATVVGRLHTRGRGI